MSILLQFSYPQLSIINILLLSDQLFQGSVAPHLDVLSIFNKKWPFFEYFKFQWFMFPIAQWYSSTPNWLQWDLLVRCSLHSPSWGPTNLHLHLPILNYSKIWFPQPSWTWSPILSSLPSHLRCRMVQCWSLLHQVHSRGHNLYRPHWNRHRNSSLMLIITQLIFSLFS